MEKEKTISLAKKILIILLIILIYPSYALIIWLTSGSPSSLKDFPTQGNWVCEEEDCTLTMHIDNKTENSYYDNFIIEINNRSYYLHHFETIEHGSFIAPKQTTKILTFYTYDLNTTSDNYLKFETNKYKFDKNDFYFLNVKVVQDNSNVFEDVKQLHFVKQ